MISESDNAMKQMIYNNGRETGVISDNLSKEGPFELRFKGQWDRFKKKSKVKEL